MVSKIMQSPYGQILVRNSLEINIQARDNLSMRMRAKTPKKTKKLEVRYLLKFDYQEKTMQLVAINSELINVNSFFIDSFAW